MPWMDEMDCEMSANAIEKLENFHFRVTHGMSQMCDIKSCFVMSTRPFGTPILHGCKFQAMMFCNLLKVVRHGCPTWNII